LRQSVIENFTSALILVPGDGREQHREDITDKRRLRWMKRKIELTIETHQLLVIKRTKGLTQGWCSECAGHIPLVKPEEAAVLASVSPRTIYAWVEAGRVHFTETTEEGLRICLNSLLDRMQA
jgi:hypothetical protein